MNRQASAWANYQRGSKRRLLEAVSTLARQLGRPVCSADLAGYFRHHPEERPAALQRLGAQLAHAARPMSRLVPFLREVGVFGHRRYYAPDDDPLWQKRLRTYLGERALQELAALDAPGCLSYLLDNPAQAPLARRALAAWAQEAATVAASADLDLPPELAGEVEWARSLAPFSGVPAVPVVERASAASLLRIESRRRVGDSWNLSVNRHLARLRWPQCALVSDSGGQWFWPHQVHLYAARQWPGMDDNPPEIAALLLCARYGLAPA